MEDLLRMKKQLAQAIRTLYGGGVLVMTTGHISIRLDDKRIMILGHTHRILKTLDEITEEDIIIMDYDGNTLEGTHEPPGECFIHSEILKMYPQVGSVVHGHPFYSKLFGIADQPILPVDNRSGRFADGVPVMDFPGQIDSPQLGKQVATVLNGKAAMLIRGHGQVVVGATMPEACVNALLLEDNAKKQLYASILGQVRPLDPKQIYIQKPTNVWYYYVKNFDPHYNEVGYLF